jgi:hypothetical protein
MEVVVGVATVATVAVVGEAMVVAMVAATLVATMVEGRAVDGGAKLPLLWMTQYWQILNSATIQNNFWIWKQTFFEQK